MKFALTGVEVSSAEKSSLFILGNPICSVALHLVVSLSPGPQVQYLSSCYIWGC